VNDAARATFDADPIEPETLPATATVPTALLHRYEAMLVAVLRGVRIDAPR
jgi:hypothetical protein